MLIDEDKMMAEKEAARLDKEHAAYDQQFFNTSKAGVGYQSCGHKPWIPPTMMERLDKEHAAYEQDTQRIHKVERLRQLLCTHPDIALILDLKAELGL